MSKSKKAVHYHLILNEHQARIVNAAVEEYTVSYTHLTLPTILLV